MVPKGCTSRYGGSSRRHPPTCCRHRHTGSRNRRTCPKAVRDAPQGHTKQAGVTDVVDAVGQLDNSFLFLAKFTPMSQRRSSVMTGVACQAQLDALVAGVTCIQHGAAVATRSRDRHIEDEVLRGAVVVRKVKANAVQEQVQLQTSLQAAGLLRTEVRGCSARWAPLPNHCCQSWCSPVRCRRAVRVRVVTDLGPAQAHLGEADRVDVQVLAQHIARRADG